MAGNEMATQDTAEVKPVAATNGDRPVFSPLVDIRENAEGLVLTADLPGVDKDGLDVAVENRVLSVSAHSSATAPEAARLIHREYQAGNFSRSFILSDEIDAEKITAELEDGVLVLRLPKVPKAQPRKIRVQGK